jgi:hypothetical protein
MGKAGPKAVRRLEPAIRSGQPPARASRSVGNQVMRTILPSKLLYSPAPVRCAEIRLPLS